MDAELLKRNNKIHVFFTTDLKTRTFVITRYPDHFCLQISGSVYIYSHENVSGPATGCTVPRSNPGAAIFSAPVQNGPEAT